MDLNSQKQIRRNKKYCFSVHDVESSACETETEDKRGNSRMNSKAVKIIRSKSSSPSRQVLGLLRRKYVSVLLILFLICSIPFRLGKKVTGVLKKSFLVLFFLNIYFICNLGESSTKTKRGNKEISTRTSRISSKKK